MLWKFLSMLEKWTAILIFLLLSDLIYIVGHCAIGWKLFNIKVVEQSSEVQNFSRKVASRRNYWMKLILIPSLPTSHLEMLEKPFEVIYMDCLIWIFLYPLWVFSSIILYINYLFIYLLLKGPLPYNVRTVNPWWRARGSWRTQIGWQRINKETINAWALESKPVDCSYWNSFPTMEVDN
jgi:hypothetical protein